MEYQSLQPMPIVPVCQTRSNSYSISDRVGYNNTHCDQQALSRLYEVFLIAMLTVSILTLISLFEATSSTQHGWGFFLEETFGDVAYLVPMLIGYIGCTFYLYWKKPFQSSHIVLLKLIGVLLFYFSMEALFKGGELGQALSRNFFGPNHAVESWVIVIAFMIAGLFMMTNLSCFEIASGVRQFGSGFLRKNEMRCYPAENSYRTDAVSFGDRREPSLISYEKPFAQPHIHDPQSNQLINCLQNFGIRTIVSNKIPGPVITRFELHLAPGVKSSTICSHHKEIARYLCVPEVRVIEVIPGKPFVGIEIPNAQRESFSFSDLNYELDQCTHEKLPLLLGKNSIGAIKVVDLESMPHLLIAGSTGSGKTMLLQSILMSLTHHMSSTELKLILIDQKFLSFSHWKNVPHLLHDIVTDSNASINALNWCVDEMERRYQVMASGCHEKFPKLVLIVDEFGDLIMTHKNEVETAVVRLAQKARQCGIHLILSTQRPTADILTGHIKSNMPVRIALSVPDRRDSRIVLDEQGSEALLGNGDMLLKMPGKICERIHAPFVSESEIREHVFNVTKQNEIKLDHVVNEVSNMTPLNVMATDKISFRKRELKIVDERFDEAVIFVKESGKASISSVQRKLKIGYGRAANIVEEMERQGIVAKRESQNGGRAVLTS
ncbi:MAG: DNA translocase FtsK [Gammaproteobacteria bacterium]|nr:DNA translocase FtsK [Gammaproteobacteria bacterium]